MQGYMGKLLQAICLAMSAAAVLMTQAILVEAAPEECRAKPDLSAQLGEGHWHYRIDRTSQRRCWFLSSSGSAMRHASSLRRRDSSNRSTASEIAQQSMLGGMISATPTTAQEPVVLSGNPITGKLAVPEIADEPSESLVPHKVTLISFVRPRVDEQNLERGTGFNLVFLCGVFATTLLFAGGVVMMFDRFHRSTRTTSPTSVPLFNAKRLPNNSVLFRATNLKNLSGYFRFSNTAAGQPGKTPLPHAQLH
jgi:hypothetical protein